MQPLTHSTITLTLAADDYDGPLVPEADAPPTTEPSEGAPANGAPGGAPAQPEPGAGGMFLPLIIILVLVVMFILMTSGQRRERKKHEAMLSRLKKGDKVQTVGGVIGTLVDLREDEVVLKVDENTNTRMRFARNAVRNILDSKEKESE